MKAKLVGFHKFTSKKGNSVNRAFFQITEGNVTITAGIETLSGFVFDDDSVNFLTRENLNKDFVISANNQSITIKRKE